MWRTNHVRGADSQAARFVPTLASCSSVRACVARGGSAASRRCDSMSIMSPIPGVRIDGYSGGIVPLSPLRGSKSCSSLDVRPATQSSVMRSQLSPLHMRPMTPELQFPQPLRKEPSWIMIPAVRDVTNGAGVSACPALSRLILPNGLSFPDNACSAGAGRPGPGSRRGRGPNDYGRTHVMARLFEDGGATMHPSGTATSWPPLRSASSSSSCSSLGSSSPQSVRALRLQSRQESRQHLRPLASLDGRERRRDAGQLVQRHILDLGSPKPYSGHSYKFLTMT